MPTSVLRNLSPYQKVFKKTPDYLSFRVFGCAYYLHLHPYQTQKFDFRSSQCVLLGSSASHKGYQCLHASSGHIYISRDVVFDESSFPFQFLHSSLSPTFLYAFTIGPNFYVSSGTPFYYESSRRLFSSSTTTSLISSFSTTSTSTYRCVLLLLFDLILGLSPSSSH